MWRALLKAAAETAGACLCCLRQLRHVLPGHNATLQQLQGEELRGYLKFESDRSPANLPVSGLQISYEVLLYHLLVTCL